MKTYFNHLTHSYDTPDGTKVAAEVCEGNNPSDAFRSATIREKQRKEKQIKAAPPKISDHKLLRQLLGN